MGFDTNFNQDPYFDDFDETKNFHRVLFKPAVAVQARELTQLQTILQNQIERFGNNILKEGTIVDGCAFTYLNRLAYAKILDLQTDGQPVVMSNYEGARAVGLSSGVEAFVVKVSTGLESQTPNLNTLHLRYVKSSTDGANKVFTTTENIRIENFTTGAVITTVTAAGTSSIGNGTGLKVADGYIYQKGAFIRVAEQTVIVDKYSITPDDLAVGFVSAETLTNSNNDTSLLDNAQGYNNENAPGADRLTVTPVLTVKSVALANADEDFFTLVEYQNGSPVKRRETTVYSTLGAEMASRTADESGNYTIRQFPLRVAAGANSDYVVAKVGPGVAYVEGFKVENYGEIDVNIDASTDFISETNEPITQSLGHYVVVDELNGNFGLNDNSLVYLYNQFQGARSANSTIGTGGAGGTQIGTARIRGLEYKTGTVSANTCQYNAYLFDIRIANTSHSFTDTKAIIYDEGTGVANEGCADVVTNSANKAVIEDVGFKKTYFAIGQDAIKATSNRQFTYTTSQTFTASGSGGNISAPSGGQFPYSDSTLSAAIKLSDLVVLDPNGNPVDLSSVTVTISGGSATMTFASLPIASGTYYVYHKTTRTSAVPVTKESKTVFVKVAANTNPGGVTGKYSLGLPDVYNIVDVYRATDGSYVANTSLSVKEFFDLKPNQRDAYYDLSYVQKKAALTIGANDTLLFEVKVFDRTGSSGAGFATVDSYTTLPTSSVDFQDIPVYTSEDGGRYDLRNVVDFRGYTANTADYAETVGAATVVTTAVGAALSFSGEQYNISPNENAEIDYDYYIGRRDRIYIDSNGGFRVVNGVPAALPRIPAAPASSMTIASVYVPPFPALTSFAANRAKKPGHAVKLKLQNIRGYTMDAIGKIDRRVQQLEYYTILNQLEQSTEKKIITDGAGNNRFKNGIFTDSFQDLLAAEVSSPDFAAAIDPARKELTPKLDQFDIDLKVSATSSVTDFGAGATLSKTDITLIDQPFATISRNCVSDFYSFAGTAFIFPDYDEGHDVVNAPDIDLEIDLSTPFVEFAEALGQFVPLQSTSSSVIAQSSSSSASTSTSTTSNWWNTITDTTTTTVTTTTSTIEDITNQLQVQAGNRVTQDVGDFVTDITFNPFMKSREVSVLAVGMRPNQKMYFFFDKVDVNAHVAPAVSSNAGDVDDIRNFRRSRTYGTQIQADADGIVRAIFRIPAGTFFVGERILEIIDVDTYAEKPNAISIASVSYNAFNYSVEKTGLSISTRPASTSVATIRDTRTSVSTSVDRRTTTSITSNPNAWFDEGDAGASSDPIAQTFMVKPEMAPNDNIVFATKLDVFFKEKSSTAGITVMLRETVNGYPGSRILPFSKIHLKASQVNANNTAAQATTVTFDAPVALRTNAEYCFVCKPDNDDPDYRVWVSKAGGTDVLNNIKVTQDVTDGTLFTSTNDRAWSAVQDENIKFKIHRANFSANTGTITFTNKESEYFTVNSVSGSFENDEYVFVNATPVSAQTINMQVGNTTIVGTNTTFSSYFSAGDHIIVKANNTVFDVLEIKTVSNNTQLILNDIPKYTNAASEFFSSIVGTVKLFNTNTPAKLYLDNSTATTSTYFTANDVVIGEESGAVARIESVDNKNISIIAPNIYRVNSTNTSTALRATRLFRDDTNANYAVNPLEFNDYNFLDVNSTVVKSFSNEKADSDANRSFALQVTLKNIAPTSGNSLGISSSPFIDTDVAAVKVFEYLVNNNSTDESGLDGVVGLATSKYVTKIVSLRDGLDAEDLNVFLTAYNPTGTTIQVYSKFLNSEDPEAFTAKPWTLMNAKATNPTSNKANRFDFRELEFGLPSSAPVSGAAFLNSSDIFEYTDGGATYNDYKYFAIKVVLLANGHHRVPRLFDIRAIALAA